MQALDMKDQANYSGKYLKLQKSMYFILEKYLSLKEPEIKFKAHQP